MTDDTGDRVFLKTLSRRRAGNFSEKFFLPARVKKVLENKCRIQLLCGKKGKSYLKVTYLRVTFSNS